MSVTIPSFRYVLLATLLFAPDLHAQAPTVFQACHVPLTGTIYRIGEPGIKPACTAATHVPFSWTDGLGAIRPATAATGDLSGSFAAPIVARLLGRPLSPTTPTNGQVLEWNGSEWTPATPAGPGASDHGALTGLADDDHPQYLLTNGTRSSSGFAVIGLTGGGIPASGPGSRVMFYANRRAFRAGRVDGTQWDTENVGEHSAAFGLNTIARGQFSAAVGRGTVAAGIGAFASGLESEAAGKGSMAIGEASMASGNHSIAFGHNATASGAGAFAAGSGASSSNFSSVALGFESVSSGQSSFAAGDGSEATADYAFALGIGAKSSSFAAISLGHSANASGDRSMALGYCANTAGFRGAFVYSDVSMACASGMNAIAHNEFAVRATGGFRFRTNQDLTTGCNLAAGGGSWVCTSSRASKQDFREIDGELVLAKLATMPIQTWHYRDEPKAIRHVGPTAEDFRAAFGLGDSDKAIGHIDADGINMRAIQALELRTRQVTELNARVADLEARLARLEQAARKQ